MRALAVTSLILVISVPSPGQDAPRTPTSPAAALPSVALPPALDRVLRDYERAWLAGNADSLVALFTEDGFVLQPGKSPVRGRAAMAAVYQGQGGGALKLRALAFAASDSVGYIIGAYGYGDAPGDIGKFTLTLRRASGGRWLIASDMDNGSQPPRRPGGQSSPP